MMSCNGGAPAAKMRMVNSCNGCRALRKGCSDHCIIRPCLEWITTPEAQGNATVFLAKFYGRAGLLNLIAAVPSDDADAPPAVFRSLIYEACGRIVNPVYGAVGLLWSGQWQKCVDAVEAMFKGELGVPVDDAVQADAASSEADEAPLPSPPLGVRLGPSAAAYDIRHFDKDSDAAVTAAAAADLLRFARAGRGRKDFKRAGSSSSSSANANLIKGKSKGKGKGKAKGMARLFKGKSSNNMRASPSPAPLGQGQQQEAEEVEPVPMVMDLLGHDDGREEPVPMVMDLLKGSTENTGVEAAASHVSQQAEAVLPVGTQVLVADQEAEEEVGLELTLGSEPVVRQQPRSSSGDLQTGSSRLRLQLPPA